MWAGPVGRVRAPGLLRLNVGVLDHLAPGRELLLDVAAELLGRRGKSFEADVLELGLDVRAVDDFAQGAVELGDHRGRRPGRRDEAGPGIEVEALDAGFVERRQI